MIIELIYTFQHREQAIYTHPFVLPILQDEKTLREFVLAVMSKEEVLDLIKVSCCVYGVMSDDKEPEWYKECNGKLWFNQVDNSNY